MIWKISAKWSSKPHNCTLAGILARCGGGCCKSPTYWPPNAYAGPNNPTHACGNLGAQGCRLTDADKPITCLLYPLVLNKAGTLILHHRTQFKTSCCKGNHGEGPPLIEAMRPQLVALFGETQYATVHAAVMAGEDGAFVVSKAIAAQYALERALEAAGARPIPRTQTG